MKIIAHRGVGGSELENSLSSLRAAFQLDVDAVEFDIHRTSDGVLVVMHDVTTGRTATENVRISETTFEHLKSIKLHNGQNIPTLEEVFASAGTQDIYVDIKGPGCADLLLELTYKFPKLHCVFISFLPSELLRVRELSPLAETFLYFKKLEYYVPRPLKMVREAKKIGATGIAIDKVFLNHAVYALARRAGMQMYTYSINTGTAAKLIAQLYPGVDIETKHPEIINRHLKTKLQAK